MKVNTPSTLTGNAAKSEAISTPYLYLEKLPNENAFIIIDEMGDIACKIYEDLKTKDPESV